MRRWMIRLLILIALLAAFWALRVTVFQAKPVVVTVTRLDRGPVEATVTNSRAGTLRSRRRAKLSPEIGGRVRLLPRREGERVAAGEVVLALDDEVYQARLTLAQRDLQAAQAEEERACLAAQRAAREYQRLRTLSQSGIISEDLLDQAQSQAETSAAACRASGAGSARAEAAVELARSELSKTVLRAPFDAIVADLSIEVGEWTTPSPPALPVPAVIDLIDPGAIYLSAPMDEVDSAHLRSGLPARITVDSHRGRSFAGRVKRVAPYVLDIEQQNRTVEIEVEFDDSQVAATLLPGTSADVEVILEVHHEALRLPTSVLLEGDRVLVIEEGKLVERQLSLGLSNWDFTEVLSGAEAGDEVVDSLDRPEVNAGVKVIVEGEGTTATDLAPASSSPADATADPP